MSARGQYAYATTNITDMRQLHSATYQRERPTRIYQNPNSAPSNVAHPVPPQPPSRPRSIRELAERAKLTLGEDPKRLKAWLRIAESARRDAKVFQEQGDLESAFMEYAKAATIALEKIPAHPGYRVILSTTQRHNVGLHGQEILDTLAEIKGLIYKQWDADTRRRREEQDDILRRQREAYLQMPLESLTRSRQDKPNKPPIQPVTTTSSLSPQLGAVKLPSLMSQHQISQGYHPSLGSMFHRESHASHSTSRGSDPVVHNLKTVSFPRDCMNWFTSIASINTAKNRETCGLLLGKDKNGRYVVTTLLIPKQHSTSDTCAIYEEELVTRFTEERFLITLGWIHTHPTQSCFMSSVDLHTHSGFQQILPESIAVVCAPNSTPNFGIFRMTDPPGLRTILDCEATEAFHRHPDLAIYTDADKGHVQIRGLPLEIVDLREQTAPELTDGSFASPSRSSVITLPSEDTLVTGFLSRYRHPKAGHDGEGEEEDVTNVARMVGGHDEPIAELEIPELRPAALHPTKTLAQRSNVSHKSTLSSVNRSDGLALPTDTSMQPEAVANPASEVFEGFDMLRRPPESQLHGQQLDYLSILQDKFGTPRPDCGHRYSFTDDNSSRNEEDEDYRESFDNPDNESINVRCSVKTVSKGSLFSPSILSPASSQLTSRFN